MSLLEAVAAPRPRRKTRVAAKPNVVKKTFYLTEDAARLLAVTASFDFRRDSDVVNELIVQHLTGGIVAYDKRASRKPATGTPCPALPTLSDDGDVPV